MVTAETSANGNAMYYLYKGQLQLRIPVLPIGKFSFLVLPWSTILLQHLIIQLSLHYLSSGRLTEVKKQRKISNFLALKVVADAYERWSLPRGSKSSDLSWKFWKTGGWGEVVTHKRWSQQDTQPRLDFRMQNLNFIINYFTKQQRWKEYSRENNKKGTKVWENFAQATLGGEFWGCYVIGPLQDPVKWDGINYTGTQITQ